MKRYLYAVGLALLLTLTLATPALADSNMPPPSPFGSESKIQGYVPIRATFPDGSVEYKVGVCWGANPLDGKISLYKSDASPKLAAFLEANDVQLTGGQYDLWSVYMHMGVGYTMIDTNGCLKGSGEKAYYGGDPRGMPEGTIQSYINSGVLLLNPPDGVPAPPDPEAPPGWLVSMRFMLPDLEAVSIDPQCGEAVFRNNTNMRVCTDLKLTYNGNLIDRENCKFFYPWESYIFRFEPKTKDGKYTAAINQNKNIRITDFTPEMLLQQDRIPGNDIKEKELVTLPPLSPSPEPIISYNLKADSIELLNKDMTPHLGDVELNKPYKVRVRYTSTFDEAGWVKLRLYVLKEAGWMDEKKSEYVYIQPKQNIEKVWDYSAGIDSALYSSINYRYGNDWIGETYNGITEADYSDNYCSLNRRVAEIPENKPPTAISFKYPLYYHPMRLYTDPIIVKQPVYGWKEVEFIKDETEYKIIYTLADDPPDWGKQEECEQ